MKSGARVTSARVTSARVTSAGVTSATSMRAPTPARPRTVWRATALSLACVALATALTGAVPTARADEPISDRERDYALMITGWSVAAVGVVGFAVLGSLTLAEDAALGRECGTHCTPARASMLDTYAIGADISAATALAGAVLGAVFTVLWGADLTAELFVRPMLPMGQLGPGGLGLSLAGRF